MAARVEGYTNPWREDRVEIGEVERTTACGGEGNADSLG
jgi:hypothetical protein